MVPVGRWFVATTLTETDKSPVYSLRMIVVVRTTLNSILPPDGFEVVVVLTRVIALNQTDREDVLHSHGRG